jgi:hypothetical protein
MIIIISDSSLAKPKSRAGLTSVRTGSAEQRSPHIRGPTHGKKLFSKFCTGVLVFGKKKKLSKNGSRHREQTSQESITDN